MLSLASTFLNSLTRKPCLRQSSLARLSDCNIKRITMSIICKIVHVQIHARSAADGITVDLSQMRGVVVDPVQQIATVQGIDAAAMRHVHSPAGQASKAVGLSHVMHTGVRVSAFMPANLCVCCN